MANGEIRVNPDSIRSYGSRAQTMFNNIRTELQKLIDDVVEVKYYGPNAADFKTKAGQMAADFAAAANKDMGMIATAVQTSTSNIAGALGGVRINISVEGFPIPAPSVAAGDGTVGVNVQHLTELKSLVTGHFDQVRSEFDSHMSDLQATDWTGSAKDRTVEAVGGYTRAAKTKADDSQTSINQFIDQQIAAVTAANNT